MLEILKGRSWSVAHTVYDSEGGPLSDLDGYTFKSQIRKRLATQTAGGDFEQELLTDVTVTRVDSTLTLSLTREQVNDLLTGTYQIDLVGTKDGEDEEFLPVEPIRVVTAPTLL
jgi:hypothetical protein